MEHRIAPKVWWGAFIALLVLLSRTAPAAAQSGWQPQVGAAVPNDFKTDNHDGGELKFTGISQWQINGYQASATVYFTFQVPSGRSAIVPYYEVWSIDSMTGKLSSKWISGMVGGSYPNYNIPITLDRFSSWLLWVKEVPTGTPQLKYTIWQTITPP